MQIFNGDCLEVMKTLDADSIDSLVSDPPAGISFMGKDWDHHKGGRDEWIKWMTSVMQEAHRVLKPGAHGLVWALPRTSHWTATALENAGFEVRDIVNHIFGTGFPKSLDISKAIDKAAGAEREVVGDNPRAKQQTGQTKTAALSGDRNQNLYITAPATSEAKQWSGWGTALKPACEHWILVRKPCSEKTVAENVLKHGTGGINIDASRVEGKFESGWAKSGSKASENLSMSGANYAREPKPDNPQGRFPANLVLDETAAEMLDKQSGLSRSTGGTKSIKQRQGIAEFNTATNGANPYYNFGDSGGASRFFYVAKASKSDRNSGLPEGATSSHPTVKNTKLMEYLITLVTPPNGTVLDPFMGSGSTGVAAKKLGFSFVGIEKETEYFEIAEKRLA